MHEFWSSFQQLMDAETLLKTGGFYLLLIVVFAETGLFFGFFLPGDYLLFLAGLFCASGLLAVDIYTLCGGLLGAAILGNYTGYYFGRRTGPMLFKKKDSLLFKRKYIVTAEEFYHKYGALALILGRFMPIIRTFAPIFAGVVRVEFKRFTILNIGGAILWVSVLTLSGYFLGQQFPQIVDYIEYIIIGFISITTVPVIIAIVRKSLKKDKNK
ncbi:DedA family protein [Albibacterium indicum]|uniref:DedA family protein n=1 Tax=Albibacterium indicum TaxID=2292082 RepID=UPI000E4B1852|nr:VTT domain-containing protein [Pedobacter indicus]